MASQPATQSRATLPSNTRSKKLSAMPSGTPVGKALRQHDDPEPGVGVERHQGARAVAEGAGVAPGQPVPAELDVPAAAVEGGAAADRVVAAVNSGSWVAAIASGAMNGAPCQTPLRELEPHPLREVAHRELTPPAGACWSGSRSTSAAQPPCQGTCSAARLARATKSASRELVEAMPSGR